MSDALLKDDSDTQDALFRRFVCGEVSGETMSTEELQFIASLGKMEMLRRIQKALREEEVSA